MDKRKSLLSMFLVGMIALNTSGQSQILPDNINWLKIFGTNLNDASNANICIDSDSNLYIFYRRDFSGPPTDFYYDSKLTESDVFATSLLLAISKSGELIWTKRFEGSLLVNYFEIDSNDNLVICAKFLQKLDIVGDTILYSNSEDYQDFIMKLDNDRSLRYAYVLTEVSNQDPVFFSEVLDLKVDSSGILGLLNFKGKVKLGDKVLTADSPSYAIFNISNDNKLQKAKIFKTLNGYLPNFYKVETFGDYVALTSEISQDYASDGLDLSYFPLKIQRFDGIPNDSVYLPNNYLMFLNKSDFSLKKQYNLKSLGATSVRIESIDSNFFMSFQAITDTIKIDTFKLIGWPLHKQRAANQPRGYMGIIGINSSLEPFASNTFYYSETSTFIGITKLKEGTISLFGGISDTLIVDQTILESPGYRSGTIFTLEEKSLRGVNAFMLNKNKTSNLISDIVKFGEDFLVFGSYVTDELIFLNETLKCMGGNDLYLARITDKITGIYNILSNFNIYPNPTTGNLSINTSSIGDNESLNVKIYNLEGKLVYQNQQSKSTPLEVEHLPNGMYILSAEANQQVFRTKFIKE